MVKRGAAQPRPAFLFAIIMQMFNLFSKKSESEQLSNDKNTTPKQKLVLTENTAGGKTNLAMTQGAKLQTHKSDKNAPQGIDLAVANKQESLRAQSESKTQTNTEDNKSVAKANKAQNMPSLVASGDSFAANARFTAPHTFASDAQGKNNTNPPSQNHSEDTARVISEHKPQVVSMMSAIEKSAGVKERKKWQDKLNARRTFVQPQYKKKDSPEYYLHKQEESSQAPGIKAKNEANSQASPVRQNKQAPKGTVITKRTGTVRTFKGDLQRLMQNEKLSLTKIVAIESDKRKYVKQKEAQKKESSYSWFAIFILSASIVLTLALFAYAVYLNNRPDTSKSRIDALATGGQNSNVQDLIFIENKTKIDISGKNRIYILRVLQAARDSKRVNATLGSITEFELVKKIGDVFIKLSAKDFLRIIFPKAPDTFVASLDPNYMLGVHAVSKSIRKPFVILKTNSYHYAFAAMLSWEKTMVDDMGIFMDAYYRKDITGYLDEKPRFKDASLKNYSVRVLYSSDGKVRILYGFIGEDTLVITNSPKTFLEIANRLAIEQGQ